MWRPFVFFKRTIGVFFRYHPNTWKMCAAPTNYNFVRPLIFLKKIKSIRLRRPSVFNFSFMYVDIFRHFCKWMDLPFFGGIMWVRTPISILSGMLHFDNCRSPSSPFQAGEKFLRHFILQNLWSYFDKRDTGDEILNTYCTKSSLFFLGSQLIGPEAGTQGIGATRISRRIPPCIKLVDSSVMFCPGSELV